MLDIGLQASAGKGNDKLVSLWAIGGINPKGGSDTATNGPGRIRTSDLTVISGAL